MIWRKLSRASHSRRGDEFRARVMSVVRTGRNLGKRAGRSLCGVEVKSGATVVAKDFKARKRLRDAMGDRFHRGAVLHDGERILSFGDRLFAVPFHELWRAAAWSADRQYRGARRRPFRDASPVCLG